MKREATQNPETLFNIHYNVIAPLLMGAGVGDGKTTACIMAQAATIDALRNGKTLDEPTDEMECACPVLRRMAIRANDACWWKDNEERTEHLRPLIPLLLDSRVSKKAEWKRAFLVVNHAVRIITPMRLEVRAQFVEDDKLKEKYLAWADQIRKIKPIVSKQSAGNARDICRDIRDAAYADADADAYAYAADAADAAYAYAAYADAAYADAYAAYAAADAAAAAADADAAADAAYAAYAAAYAADAADAAYAQKLKYRTLYLELFRKVAAIKK